MPDKTIVNDGVSESPDNQDSSLSRKGDDALLKSPEKQSWENQAKEYQRKYNDLSDRFDDLSSQIEELKSQPDKSRADNDRIDRLEDRRDALKDKRDAILSNPEAKPWLTLTEEISETSSKKHSENAVYEYDYRQALKLVKKEAKTFGVDSKEFETELFGILKGGRWEFDDKGRRIMPTERVENAIEEWARLTELRKKADKKDEPQFAERGGKSTERAKTRIDDIQSARESGSWRDLLAKKSATQQSQFK